MHCLRKKNDLQNLERNKEERLPIVIKVKLMHEQPRIAIACICHIFNSVSKSRKLHGRFRKVEKRVGLDWAASSPIQKRTIAYICEWCSKPFPSAEEDFSPSRFLSIDPGKLCRSKNLNCFFSVLCTEVYMFKDNTASALVCYTGLPGNLQTWPRYSTLPKCSERT